MGIISVTLSRLCIFSPRLPPRSSLLFLKKIKKKNYQAAPALVARSVTEDYGDRLHTERMCRARLARNRESNWANEFLGRALSCNYTLTCLTILLPLNPAALLYLPTAIPRYDAGRADLNAPKRCANVPKVAEGGGGWEGAVIPKL